MTASLEPRRRTWLANCLGLLAVVGLVVWHAPIEIIGAAVLVELVLTARLLSGPAAQLVGPLFFCEVIRLARRGRSILLRSAYALLLLGGLYLAYDAVFPGQFQFDAPFAPGPRVRLDHLASLASRFAGNLLALQILAVLVLTPAYLSGAVVEEREKRTLELLFTTDLSNREIVLGKMFGRLSHLVGILLAGLPILSILQVWGGVSLSVVLLGTFVTGVTLFSVAGVSIACSVMARSSFQALLTSCAIVLVFSFCCVPIPLLSPLAFLGELLSGSMGIDIIEDLVSPQRATTAAEDLAYLALFFGLLQVVIGLTCMLGAIGALRKGADVEKRTLPPPPKPRPRRVPRHDPTSNWPRFPVTDSPLLWKEVYHGAGPTAALTFWPVYLTMLVLTTVLLFLLVLVSLADTRPGLGLSVTEPLGDVRDRCNLLLRVCVSLVAGCCCFGTAWHAAGTITHEREQRTLAGLLMLPVSHVVLLGAKWAGGPLRCRSLLYALAAFWTMGLLSATMHPLGVLSQVVAVAIHIAFLASLGVWLSLMSRNTRAAYLAMALTLLFLLVGPWVVQAYSEMLALGGQGEGWWDDFHHIGLSPVRTWWRLGYSWSAFQTNIVAGQDTQSATAALAGLGVYAFLAGLFWLAAVRRFAHEQPPSA